MITIALISLSLLLSCRLTGGAISKSATDTADGTPNNETTGNCIAGGASYGLYFDFTRSDVVSLRWSNMPVRENTVEFWYRSTDRHQNLHNIFGYSAYDPDYPGREGVNGNRPFLYDQPNEFQLHFTPSYIMVWRGENRVLLSREINPRVGEAYQDLEWHHYAFVYSSNYNHTGVPLQRIYLDGHHLDFGSTKIDNVPNYWKAPFSSDWDVAEHEDAADYYGKHNCSVVVIDNPCQENDEGASIMFEVPTAVLVPRSKLCSDYDQASNLAARKAWAVIFQMSDQDENTDEPDVQWTLGETNTPTKLSIPVVAVDFEVGEQMRARGTAVFHRQRDPINLGASFGRPIEVKGLLTLGQEPDAHAGDFAPFQAANGILDEFRVWDVARSTDEIQGYYKRYVDVENDLDASHLSVYWTFDDMMTGIRDTNQLGEAGRLTRDLSPNGTNPGLVGALVTGEHLTYVGGPSRPPRAPGTIPTLSAPFVGQGEVIVPVAPNRSVVLELKSFDPDGDDLATTILSLPDAGKLSDVNERQLQRGDPVTDEGRTSNKRAIFKAPPDFNVDATFMYSVSDGGTPANATVRLVPHTFVLPERPPATINEGALHFFALSLPSQLTQENLKVIITQPPARGSLFQAQFKPGTDKTYDSLAKEVDQYGPMQPISNAGTTVSTGRGIVMYAPNKHEHSEPVGSIYASFHYRLFDDDAGLLSEEVEQSIVVVPINDAPNPHSGNVSVSLNSQNLSTTIITLNSTDIDSGSGDGTVRQTFARITKFPAGGILYQFDEASESNVGELVDRLKPRQPMIFAWASRVVRFSSHFSMCGGKCYSWNHPECNSNDMRAGFSANGTCTQTAFHVSNILGPHDLYPEYGNSRLSWVASKENAGFEFVELEFEYPIYITEIDVYLPYKPGAIWKISTASDYLDDLSVSCTRPGEPDIPKCSQDTDWVPLWFKPPETVSLIADNSVDFRPPVCPTMKKTKLIRLDMNTELAPGWNHIDAVKISGTSELQPGTVEDANNRLVYIPLDGIHGTDSVSFVPSDCGREGEEGTISVMIEAPEGGTFSTSAIVHQNVLLQAKPNQVVKHKLNLTSLLVNIEEFTGMPTTNASAAVWHSDALGVQPGWSASNLSLQNPVLQLSLGSQDYGRPFSMLELWLQSETSNLTFRAQFDILLQVDCENGNVDMDDGKCRCWTPRWEGHDCSVEVAENKNDVPLSFVAVAYCSYGILIFVCTILGIVVYENMEKTCIKVSQPLYLFVLLFGSILTGTAIPLFVQSSDAACAASYWCFFLGFATMMGAIYAKIWRTYMVFTNGMAMIRRQVSVMETAHIVLALVGVHAVVLTLWVVFDPPYWQRTVIETDGDGYVLSTIGECRSTIESPFLMSLLFLNIGIMCLAGYVCYKVRNIPDKFQESSSVAFAVFTIANIYIIGIPVLMLVDEDPTIRLYVCVGIVFLVVAIVLSSIFGNLLSLLFFQSEESVRTNIASQIRVHSSGGQSVHTLGESGHQRRAGSNLSLQTSICEDNIPGHNKQSTHTLGDSGRHRRIGSNHSLPTSIICEDNTSGHNKQSSVHAMHTLGDSGHQRRNNLSFQTSICEDNIPGHNNQSTVSGAGAGQHAQEAIIRSKTQRFQTSLDCTVNELESLLEEHPAVFEKQGALGEVASRAIPRLEGLLRTIKHKSQCNSKTGVNSLEGETTDEDEMADGLK